MLTHLFLKDFAVVSEAEVDFGPGLTVVSGETGAGKSLMVDALMLLSGARADATMVRHGASRAELVAEFRLDDAPDAAAWLAAQALDDEGGGLQLRRVVSAEGGSRAWINGRPATIGQLAELGRTLLEIHGQHEHQALLSRAHQLALLDGFGGHAAQLEAVRASARDWAETDAHLSRIEAAGDVGERIEWLRHQVRELDRETLEPDAVEALFAEHRRLANAQELIAGCARAQAGLAGEENPAAADLARGAGHELQRLARDEPRLAEVAEMLEGAAVQLDEALASLERIRDDLELDPERLDELDAQLARLGDLGRKHRVAIEELHAHREALRSELDALEADAGSVESLKAERERRAGRWREAAEALSRARREAGDRLGTAVSALMDTLGMAGGRLEVVLEAGAGTRPDPQGAERVELMVSANPGMPLRPLRKVASGGELSRISLAIEVAGLAREAVASMVFDEVDTGIGGGVAETVGRTLRALGERRQALCVTHLPQVAAQGHAHYRVEKSVEDGRTHTRVVRLDPEQRREEIARMLGGREITRETREHAAQMLRSAAKSQK